MDPLPLREVVRRLRRLGFDGPFAGGEHPYMQRGRHKVIIPNPHGSVVDGALIARILRQAGISPEDWEQAG
jgi:predicted RNA binding protein YcfA (HicA-like mRNA interferase family)